MSDLVIWARIVEERPTQFLVIVSSAAPPGEETSATDVRSAEAASYYEAVKRRDAIVAAMTEAIERRGHRVANVEHLRIGPQDQRVPSGD